MTVIKARIILYSIPPCNINIQV